MFLLLWRLRELPATFFTPTNSNKSPGASHTPSLPRLQSLTTLSFWRWQPPPLHFGNGASVKVWEDLWLSLSSPSRQMGHATKENKDLTVQDLMIPNITQWDLAAIRLHVPDSESDIRKLIVGSLSRPNRLKWLPVRSGEYSTKTGYALTKMHKEAINGDDFNWLSGIWHLKTTPKIRTFLWKAMANALPIGSNLQPRGVPSALLCKRCGSPETPIHVFLNCPLAKRSHSQPQTKSRDPHTSIQKFL